MHQIERFDMSLMMYHRVRMMDDTVIVRVKTCTMNNTKKTLGLCSSVDVRDQVPHPSVTAKIIYLCILTGDCESDGRKHL
jgi:hypothetical protein